MSDEPTEYTKLSDHALQERVTLDGVSRILTVYDFNTEQITTLQRMIYWRGDACDVETETLRQNFNEVAPRALQFAHARLIELGGNPPPLEDCNTVPKKKPSGPLKLD